MLGLSVCRNPKLAAIFYRLQLIEAYGTGMPKIMNAYAGTGLEPKIEVTNNAFKITLPNRNAVKVTDSVVGGRKSNEEKILDLIAQNGHVVRSDVDQLLDVSQTTASRILKRMVIDGLIYCRRVKLASACTHIEAFFGFEHVNPVFDERVYRFIGKIL